MDPKVLGVVAFRVLAVYLVIWGMGNLSNLYYVYSLKDALPGPGDASHPVLASLVYGFSLVVPVLAGLALWRWAPVVAERVVPAGTYPSGDGAYSLEKIQAVALATVGLLVIFWTLPILTVRTYALFTQTPPEFSTIYQNPYKSTELVAMSLQVLFGLWLVLGARSWTRLLHRFQEFGLKEKQ